MALKRVEERRMGKKFMGRRVFQLSGSEAVDEQSCQDSDRSEASLINCGIVKQRCQELGHVEDKGSSQITQLTAVLARQPAAVPIGSPLS